MKIVQTGDISRVYPDDLKVYDDLPIGYYNVMFDEMSGFYLSKHEPFNINEDKIYGVHLNKVKKVINNFKIFDRNLGVILSGEKGIGKSLFAKLLSEQAIENKIPVIIVSEYIHGIANYIESINQEVLILFDEFDKTFNSNKENEIDKQSTLLSLFDGTTSGKKLFVVTCNEIFKLNDFLVNRPGRFHYHFRFNYPNSDEISEYLKDKLNPLYYNEIEKVIMFSKKINLNYDCLRAIVFELNNGETFETAIQDLNIIDDNNFTYDLSLLTDKGELTNTNLRIDLFTDKTNLYYVSIYENDNLDSLGLYFNPKNIKYLNSDIMYIEKNNIKLYLDDSYLSDESKDFYSKLNIDKLIIKKHTIKNLHFAI